LGDNKNSKSRRLSEEDGGKEDKEDLPESKKAKKSPKKNKTNKIGRPPGRKKDRQY